VLFASDLPRTRNMKVMRRLIRNALLGLPEGDTTALLDPEAVRALRELRPTLMAAGLTASSGFRSINKGDMT